MTEEWRPVFGEPLLQASSLGRVRSLPYQTPMPRGGFKTNEMKPTAGVVCRAFKNAAHSYRKVLFRRKNYKVHRLVTLAFHGPPPSPKHEVLHLDEDGLNNLPGNLRWGTHKENHSAPGFIAYCRSRTGDNSPARKGAARKAAALA